MSQTAVFRVGVYRFPSAFVKQSKYEVPCLTFHDENPMIAIRFAGCFHSSGGPSWPSKRSLSRFHDFSMIYRLPGTAWAPAPSLRGPREWYSNSPLRQDSTGGISVTDESDRADMHFLVLSLSRAAFKVKWHSGRNSRGGDEKTACGGNSSVFPLSAGHRPPRNRPLSRTPREHTFSLCPICMSPRPR